MTAGRLQIWMTVLLGVCLAATMRADVVIDMGGFEFAGQGEASGEVSSGLTPPAPDNRFVALQEELDRYLRHEKWPEAFSVVQSMQQLPQDGFGQAGNAWLPVSQLLMKQLLALPPAGRQAYRLFHEAQADAALRQLPANADTAAVETLAQRWFLTDAGAELADRAAIAHFRDGRFLQAANWWRLLLAHHPGDNTVEANRTLRLVTALVRANAIDAAAARIDQSRRLLDVAVTVGGQKVPLREALPERKPAADKQLPPDFRIDPNPLWRHLFFDLDVEESAGQLPNHQIRQVSSVIAATTPSVLLADKLAIVDWRRSLQAVELKTGRLAWRQLRLSQIFDQNQAYRILPMIPGPSAQLVDNQLLVSVLRSNERPQGTQLIARINPANGELAWDSNKIEDLRRFRPISNFLTMDDGRLGCLGYVQKSPITLALAVIPGNLPTPLTTKAHEQSTALYEIGSLNLPNNTFRMLSAYLVRTGDVLSFTLSTGQTAAYDPAAKQLLWLADTSARTPTPINGHYNHYASEFDTVNVLYADGVLIVKAPNDPRISAISILDGDVRWHRPCLAAATLVKQAGNLFLLATEGGLSAISAIDGKMVWHAPLPDGIGKIDPLVTESELVVLTHRGIVVLDRRTGDRRQMIRGVDLEAAPSELIYAGDRILAVSSAGVTCYPITNHTGATQ